MADLKGPQIKPQMERELRKTLEEPFGSPGKLSHKKFMLDQLRVLKDLKKGSLSRIRYKEETPFRRFAVGLSCGAYNLPGIIIQSKWKKQSNTLKKTVQGWFFFQSVVSYMSDVHFAGRTSLVHYLDRIFASGTGMAMIICLFYLLKKSLSRASIALFHGMLSLYFLTRSRKSLTYRDFAIWHCVWHYFSAYSMALVLAMTK